MTATITPPTDCPDLKRNQPTLRENDYASALEFYLNVSSDAIDTITFAENSDSDLSALKELVQSVQHNKVVEFISFPHGNDYPPEYGKGYGEMRLINYALERSQSLRQNNVTWKGTGRLILKNIEALIQSTPPKVEVYCDVHKKYPLISKENFFDPRFYAFTIGGYDRYFRVSDSELQGAHIEHIYFDRLMQVDDRENVRLRFASQPIILGWSGAENVDYHSTRKRVRKIIQGVSRTVFPGLWL